MAPWLVRSRVLPLPVAAETAGRVVPMGEEVRLLINQPGDGRTEQYRVGRTFEIDPLPPLPGVAAGACAGQGKLIVTGSNRDGQAVVMEVAQDGSVTWEVVLAGEIPTRWPVPGCGAEPMIVWQTNFGAIESAVVGPRGLSQRSSFAAGGPPLDVAIAGGSVWAVWSDATGVIAAKSSTGHRQETKVDEAYSSQLAVAADDVGIWVAWGRDRAVSLVRMDHDGQRFTPAGRFDLGDATGGSFELIPAAPPVLLARRFVELDEEPQWKSVLASADGRSWGFDGLLHSAASWGDSIVALGQTKLLFLQRT